MDRYRGKTPRAFSIGAAVLSGGLMVGTLAIAHRGEGMHPGFEEKVKEFDKNGDGKLDDAERQAMRTAFEARKKEMIAKFDKNKDGKLDEGERKEMMDAKATEWFGKLDADRDGKLTLEEFKAGAKLLHDQHGGMHHGVK